MKTDDTMVWIALRHLSRRMCQMTQHCCRHNSSSVRVRFAPSPTGQLHLGGLRTALYNFLFARSHGGKFILRIEDTDQSRLVPGSMEKLMSMLDWAGIQVDEGPMHPGEYGPYIQSERINIYWDRIQPLLENGSAYCCFCTPKRLELLKKDSLRRRETPRYDNRCRHLTPEQVVQKLKNKEPHVIRFKLETYTEPWEDLVFGPITCDVASIEGDPVLLKTDRFPTYHFANVVDDHLMKITHVLRGKEWQVSTTKHILLYRAFQWEPPQFAHLPLILNPDGSKLSKRQNDIQVEHFQRSGYFPEAVLNLITNSGSGFMVQSTAGMNMNELIKHFDLSKMKTNSTKLESRIDEFNQHHLRRALNGHKRALIISQLQSLVREKFSDRLMGSSLQEEILSAAYIGNVLDWAAKERIHKIEDLLTADFEFLWSVPDLVANGDLPNPGRPLLDVLHMTIQALDIRMEEEFDRKDLTGWLREFCKQEGMKYGPCMMALRLGLSGLREGPSVAEMMNILGKKRSIQRLQHALDQIKGQQS